MIKKIPHLLSEAECESIITIFEESKKTQTHRDTQILPYRNEKILKDLSKYFKMESLLNPDAMEIVKWPTGSKMAPHIDPDDKYAVVIYLNDNFKGGRTLLENKMINPETGKLIVFNSQKMEHGVEKVMGDRFTYISWWKKQL